MPFPAMGQNNDPQVIRRSCPNRDYVACFTKELRERYPFTQYHKRHPPPSCYTGAARARAVLQALHLVGDDPECRAPSPDEVPMLSHVQAGILLEVLKDMLYQCFVRRGKLTRALKVRRFFVQERGDDLASSA